MTTEDLKRLDELRDETKLLREQLKRLNSMSIVSAAGLGAAAGGSGSDPVSRLATRKTDIEQKIHTNESLMNDIIFDARSARLWEVLRLYFVEGNSWQNIADELGYSSASGPCTLVSLYRESLNVI